MKDYDVATYGDLMAPLEGLRERWGGWHREPFTASSTRHVSVYESG